MRRRSVATALVALAAGAATSAALRLAARRRTRRPAPAAAADPGVLVAAGVLTARAAVEAAQGADAVVLPFTRPAAQPVAQPAAAAEPVAPARCGDTGGRTKAGALCAARATSGGRCHHHRVAA
jgi:hypothetical protein